MTRKIAKRRQESCTSDDTVKITPQKRHPLEIENVSLRELRSKNHQENLGIPPKEFWQMKHRVIPNRSLYEIIPKIERAHQRRESKSPVSQHNKIPPTFGKIYRLGFTEEIKISFIKATKNGTY